jgi:hypothetical protein
MLKNNIYNIGKEFDYPAIKDIVVKSLQKIVKEEALKNIPQNVILLFYIHDLFAHRYFLML